jgi:hypothetical protein
LHVNRNDPPDGFYAAAFCIGEETHLLGWLYPHETKLDEWWDPHGSPPYWAVPEAHLHPPESLRLEVASVLYRDALTAHASRRRMAVAS